MPTAGRKGAGRIATMGGGGTKPRRTVFVPLGASGASVTVITAIVYATLSFAPGREAASTGLSSTDVTLPTTTRSALATRLGRGSASAGSVPARAVSVAAPRARPARAAGGGGRGRGVKRTPRWGGTRGGTIAC